MKKYLLNTFLTAVITLALLAMVITRAVFPIVVFPIVVFPGFGIPNLVLVSLVALLLDHYMAKDAPRCYICIPVLAFAAFALLPLAAGFAAPVEALLLGV